MYLDFNKTELKKANSGFCICSACWFTCANNCTDSCSGGCSGSCEGDSCNRPRCYFFTQF